MRKVMKTIRKWSDIFPLDATAEYVISENKLCQIRPEDAYIVNTVKFVMLNYIEFESLFRSPLLYIFDVINLFKTKLNNNMLTTRFVFK